jgi:hypothetical protein
MRYLKVLSQNSSGRADKTTEVLNEDKQKPDQYSVYHLNSLKDFERSSYGLTKVLYRHFPRRI